MGLVYQRLAASYPGSSAEAELYLVPSSAEVIGVLRVCNQDSSQHTFSVAHTDTSGSAASEDWVAYNRSLPAGTYEEMSFSMAAGESIRIQSDSASALSYVFEGLKKT